jgi:hypothetical protein
MSHLSLSEKEYQHKWYLENREKRLAANRKWKMENPEKQLAYVRKWRLNNPGKARKWDTENMAKKMANAKRWQGENPEARQAHLAVHHAIESGKIKKSSSCQKCEKPGPVLGHHGDYSKPLDVQWLCYKCHGNLHASEGGAQ